MTETILHMTETKSKICSVFIDISLLLFVSQP